MDPTLALWGLAAAIVSFALAYLLKGPKQYHDETASRVMRLEDRHTALSERFSTANAETIIALRQLTEALKELSSDLKEMKKEVHQLLRK